MLCATANARKHAPNRTKQIFLVLQSPLNPSGAATTEMAAFAAKHGDAVKDVAFQVDNCRAIYDVAVKRGAVSVKEPYELKDEHGVVVLATIKTYGDCTHTFVERQHYKGVFLPGFRDVPPAERADAIAAHCKAPNLSFIDHVVGNQDDHQMQPVVEWYEKVLQFHRFWSVDDKMVSRATFRVSRFF